MFNLTNLVTEPRKDFVFQNWAKIYTIIPQLYFQPSTVDEITAIVNSAKKEKKSIITVGSGHSPSNICITKDWIINLDNFKKIHSLKEYREFGYADIEVDAGLKIYELSEYLDDKGWAIQNLGSISEQTVAGIISTGTHGSSPYHGLVSSQYVNLTMINGKGEIIFLDSVNNVDIFKAGLLSLGKIGIIIKATIRVIPKFNIQSKEEIITLDDLINKWDTIWTSSEFIRIWWYPYTRKCILWRGEKTDKLITKSKHSWWGTKWGRLFYEFLLWFSVKIYPSSTPYIEKFVFNRQYGYLKNKQIKFDISKSVDGLNMDCLFSQFVDEWACPLNNGPEILRSLDHYILQASDNKDFYVHVPIEVRCSNTTLPNTNISINNDKRNEISQGSIYGNIIRPYLDNTPKDCKYSTLENVTNNQLTLYINVTVYRPFGCNPPIRKWFTLFEETMSAANGKPHWAKNFLGSTRFVTQPIKNDEEYDDFELRGMATMTHKWYGEDLDKFKQIRREQDPDNIFVGNKEWALSSGIIDPEEIDN